MLQAQLLPYSYHWQCWLKCLHWISQPFFPMYLHRLNLVTLILETFFSIKRVTGKETTLLIYGQAVWGLFYPFKPWQLYVGVDNITLILKMRSLSFSEVPNWTPNSAMADISIQDGLLQNLHLLSFMVFKRSNQMHGKAVPHLHRHRQIPTQNAPAEAPECLK